MENKNNTAVTKDDMPEPAVSHRTKIIVERSFGEENLLELYSGYVAERVQEQMKTGITEEFSV